MRGVAIYLEGEESSKKEHPAPNHRVTVNLDLANVVVVVGEYARRKKNRCAPMEFPYMPASSPWRGIRKIP